MMVRLFLFFVLAIFSSQMWSINPQLSDFYQYDASVEVSYGQKYLYDEGYNLSLDRDQWIRVQKEKTRNGSFFAFIHFGNATNSGVPKFPKDQVTAGARRLANKAMTETDPKKAKAFRELIPKNQKGALSKHFDNVADFNKNKRGSGVQVDLQKGRARFLNGKTNTPPGNASNFNKKSLK